MGKKILIVDDEPNIVMCLEFLLQKAGFEVMAAGDGEVALAKIAAEKPDLVLLDIMLPKKSGYEVCEAVRGDPAFAGMKIVMVSARGRAAEVAKGLALGADAYITKPFSTSDLLAEVQALLAA